VSSPDTEWKLAACARLRRAQEVHGWTHTELAWALGELTGWDAAPGVIARWAAGDNSPPGDVVTAAEYLSTHNTNGTRIGPRLQLVGGRS
jgi:hypothetical protein